MHVKVIAAQCKAVTNGVVAVVVAVRERAVNVKAHDGNNEVK